MVKNKMEIENIFSSNKHLLDEPEVKELIDYTMKLQDKIIKQGRKEIYLRKKTIESDIQFIKDLIEKRKKQGSLSGSGLYVSDFKNLKLLDKKYKELQKAKEDNLLELENDLTVLEKELNSIN